MDSADAVLRKLNLQSATRTATRTIEAWLRPVYTTQSPLKTDQAIDLNNHNIFVDSFNSADPTRSVNGAPDARDSNGHLLTNIGQFDAPNFNVPLQPISLPIRHSPLSVTRLFTAMSLLMGVPLMEVGPLLQTYPTLKVRLSMIITNQLNPSMHRNGVTRL